MEIQFISDQVKIAVLVEEELYDFTDEKLERIYKCRDDEDNISSPIGKVRNNLNVGGHHHTYQDGLGQRAESENSDTESALQDRQEHFNNGFLEDADHEHESVGMVSSMSQSVFSEMETSDCDFDSVKRIQVLTNPVKERKESSKNQLDQGPENQSQKKRIVPEPWLSDTNYFVESDESFDEQDSQPDHFNTNATQSRSKQDLIFWQQLVTQPIKVHN